MPKVPAATQEAVVDADAAGPAARRPLSPEELADRLVPDNPELSPDGRAVLFTVAPNGKKGEHKEQTIWISRDGAPAQPFTSGTAHDSYPRWSPDGSRIVFCSDRAERGVFKLYLIAAGGGEARPLGDLQSDDLQAPRWSPDGRTVAVLRKDPETPEEKKRKKEERDDAIVVGGDPKRARLWVVDVESGKARCLTYGTRHVWDYCWAPDGGRLAMVTTSSPEVNSTYDEGDLWLLPLAGGLAKLVVTFPTMPTGPLFAETSDGPVIAVQMNDKRADSSDSVWTVPMTGGQPRNLLAGKLGAVERLVARPGNPSGMAVRMVERTHASVYGVDASSGALTPLTPAALHGRGSIVGGPSFSADGTRLAVVWSDGATPEEIHVGDAGGAAAAVTKFGEAFANRLQPWETVQWASTDGLEIEGLLMLPAGYEPGTRVPLLVEIHGGPHWQWEDRVFLDWHDWALYLASHGYAVLAPNPRGSTGYGAAFTSLLQDDVGGGEAQDLISGALAMVERGVADPERLAIGGWSWGGYLTAWTITQTDIFKAAVMGAGLSNMLSDHGQDDIPSYNLLIYPGQPYDHPDAYWNSSPVRYVKNVKTPTLILHGDEDARVHPAQGMEFYRAFKTLGIPVEFVRYPREGHGIAERAHQIDLMRRLLAWLDRWLKS
jgi:dipeptidyl aminopeptidase/acylaminoacyl peptidase